MAVICGRFLASAPFLVRLTTTRVHPDGGHCPWPGNARMRGRGANAVAHASRQRPSQLCVRTFSGKVIAPSASELDLAWPVAVFTHLYNPSHHVFEKKVPTEPSHMEFGLPHKVPSIKTVVHTFERLGKLVGALPRG